MKKHLKILLLIAPLFLIIGSVYVYLTISGISIYRHPALSPDKTKLAYVLQEGRNSGIWISDIANKKTFKVSGTKGNVFFPTWAVDGKSLVFSSNINGTFDLFSFDLNTGKISDVLKDQFNNFGASYSPDGKKIAFHSDREGGYAVYIYGTKDKKIRRLSPKSGNNPSWSSDGKTIAFSSNVGDKEENWEIFTIDITGKNLKRLTNNKSEDVYPAWSPDGNKIAFTSNREGVQQTYVMKLSSKTPKRIDAPNEISRYPQWFNDKSLIVNTRSKRAWFIEKIDLSNESRTLLIPIKSDTE